MKSDYVRSRAKNADHFLSTTYGGMLSFESPQFKIEDIALSLSRIPRFGGHGRWLCDPKNEAIYSVLHHTLLVADYFYRHSADRGLELAALLHDAEEAYLGDLPSPWYERYPAELERYRHLKVHLRRKIFAAFGAEYKYYRYVKDVDALIVRPELEALFRFDTRWKNFPIFESPRVDIIVEPAAHTPMEMRRIFVKRVGELQEEVSK